MRMFSAALIVVALAAASPASAQVIDLASVTCKDFLAHKKDAMVSIMMWLSGYYHGKHGGTVVDFGALQREADKVEDYCRLNLDMTVMDAVEGALAVGKK